MRGGYIRGLLPAVCAALAVLCLPVCAQETPPTPLPEPQVAPEVVTTPPPSERVYEEPQVPAPYGEVPCPVAPSLPTSTEPPLPEITSVYARTDNFIEVNADDIRTEGPVESPVLTAAVGHVTAHYKNMQISSDRGRVNHKTDFAEFEGSVVFKIDTQTVTGERLELNMRTGQWSFTSARAVIVPEFLKGYIAAPLYARAGTLGGLRARELYANDSAVTSCDLANPHYELVSRSVTVYPEDKIVFRDASAYILGRRLFTMRRLVIPIRDIQRNPELIPRVGNSVEEGAYLKTAFAYMGNRAQSGIILLDLMQRKGIGAGLRHTYRFSSASGELYAYFLRDNNISQDTFTGRFSHDQRLGTVKLNFASDYRVNSYLYAPDSSTMINRLTLTRNRVGANTSLALTQTVNESLIRTSNLSGNLHHLQYWGDRTSLDTTFDYLAFDSFGQTRARLTSDAMFVRKEDKFDWSLNATTLTDLSDEAFVGGGQFAGIERLPEVAIMTDTARLGDVLPFKLPARLKLSYGKFAELPSSIETDRAYIEVASPLQRFCLGPSTTLGLGAGFRQFLYGDDTAQYSIDAGAELRRRLGEKSAFALTYRLQQPKGFTPFRFDFIGKYNIVNASLNVQETERFKLSLLTGYNFEQPDFPWQDVVLRCSVQASPSLLLYTATGYDINQSSWRTLINQVRIRAGDRFKLDIGTRYDTTRQKLATIRTVLDTKLGDKLRLQALAGYNGITHQFDYRSVMLTRDLHCWEASLMYVNQGGFFRNEGIFLNFRIKAFPVYQDYGVGPFGQALDTSVGQVY